MALTFSKSTILFVLLLGGALFPLVSFGDDAAPFVFLEEKADSEDFEELSDSKLVSGFEPSFSLCNPAGFRTISDDDDHQIDWLFVREHAARAPPLA